ncbi:MAG: ROK family protein [Actinomycetales bacterium]|nr:ROK family protein [Actinomycetales bacterium]
MSAADASRLALAVDLGGTKVEAALVDETGRLLAGSRHRRPTGPERSEEELALSVTEAVAGALAALPEGAEVVGAGIGSAGPVRLPDRTSPLNLPAWRDYPLRDLIAAQLPGAPVTLSIDGVCIALAEHWIGAAVGESDLMGMIVSTGVGGGLILGGHTVAGPSGNAGHIGHVQVSGFDVPCKCGGRGCLEAIASGPNSVAWARAQGWDGRTGEDLGRAHAAGDPIAIAAVERSGRATGEAIASATALVDLAVVAIGGGFSRVAPAWFDHVRAAIATHADFGFVAKVRVVPSGLSDEGPLVGAAALVHRPELIGAR